MIDNLNRTIGTTASLLVLVLISFWGCSEFEMPDNPYDGIVYDDTTNLTYPIISNSITDLHQRIFEPKCASPGCHDGNFEPDFRTVQSSYSTLVWHPIVKNSVDTAYSFRVIPNDTGGSVLHERLTNCCFVNTDDRMPQDNIGVPLPPQDILDIESWILDGAKDMFGNSPLRPDTEPDLEYFLLLKSDLSTTYRTRYLGVYYNPVLIPNNENITAAFVLSDDQTPVQSLQVNQLKLSLRKDNFTNAITMNCNFTSFGGTDYWTTTFSTGNLMADTTYFMRYYMNDGAHVSDTEFPSSEMTDAYKTYNAFRITP